MITLELLYERIVCPNDSLAADNKHGRPFPVPSSASRLVKGCKRILANAAVPALYWVARGLHLEALTAALPGASSLCFVSTAHSVSPVRHCACSRKLRTHWALTLSIRLPIMLSRASQPTAPMWTRLPSHGRH